MDAVLYATQKRSISTLELEQREYSTHTVRVTPREQPVGGLSGCCTTFPQLGRDIIYIPHSDASLVCYLGDSHPRSASSSGQGVFMPLFSLVYSVTWCRYYTVLTPGWSKSTLTGSISSCGQEMSPTSCSLCVTQCSAVLKDAPCLLYY